MEGWISPWTPELHNIALALFEEHCMLPEMTVRPISRQAVPLLNFFNKSNKCRERLEGLKGESRNLEGLEGEGASQEDKIDITGQEAADNGK